MAIRRLVCLIGAYAGQERDFDDTVVDVPMLIRKGIVADPDAEPAAADEADEGGGEEVADEPAPKKGRGRRK